MAREWSAEWDQAALGELVESATDGPFGSNLKSEHYVTRPGVRVIRLQNIGEGKFNDADKAWVSEAHALQLGRHEVQAEDVLVASLGDDNYPFARACLYPSTYSPGIVKADCFRLRCDRTHVIPGFIMRALNCASLRKGLNGLAQGVTRDRVNLGNLLRYRVPVPPLAEQRRIAEILDTVDEAIRQTEQLIAKLKQMKQGLLHDLLTRGIDDNGELRDPEQHPEQFQESPLGRIPREWNVAALGEVVPRAIYGISTSLGAGLGIPVLRMNNIKDGEAELSDLKYSNRRDALGLLLRSGDVLFNRTNSIDHVGRTGIWRGQIEKASFASYLVRLEPDPNRLDNEFLNRWLNWETTQIRIRRFATPGVHQVNINPTNLRKTTIALPMAVAEQERIAECLMTHDRAMAAEGRELRKLRFLKQGMMEDLLTGRVRVTELENAK